MTKQEFLDLIKGSKLEQCFPKEIEKLKQREMCFEEEIKGKKEELEKYLYKIYEFIKSEMCKILLMLFQKYLEELIHTDLSTEDFTRSIMYQRLFQELLDIQEEIEKASPEEIKELITKICEKFESSFKKESN